jgi:hypothetical protein
MIKLSLVTIRPNYKISTNQLPSPHVSGLIATSGGEQDELHKVPEYAEALGSSPDCTQFVVRQDTISGALTGLAPRHAPNYRTVKVISPATVPRHYTPNDFKSSGSHDRSTVILNLI